MLIGHITNKLLMVMDKMIILKMNSKLDGLKWKKKKKFKFNKSKWKQVPTYEGEKKYNLVKLIIY